MNSSGATAISEVYSRANIYDLAFSYRDYRAEVAALLLWYREHASRSRPRSLPHTALELAAGPARHSIELARRGVTCTAIDLSPEMCEFAMNTATQENVALSVVQGDMMRFSLPCKFDLVFQMLDSASHILSSAELIRHLECVARHLHKGGIYVVELSRPRRRGEESTTTQSWSIERNGLKVDVRWGDESGETTRPWTPHMTQIEITASAEGHSTLIRDSMRLRSWGPKAFERALANIPPLALAAKYGAFDPSIGPNAPNAWRLIYVITKIAQPKRE